MAQANQKMDYVYKSPREKKSMNQICDHAVSNVLIKARDFCPVVFISLNSHKKLRWKKLMKFHSFKTFEFFKII